MVLGKLFGNNKAKQERLKAPITGKVIPIEEVPDPVFAEKMMGDGIAFIPAEGKVVAPIEATVKQVFPTKHAIGLESNNGLEILIHIGLDTVNMKGEGFIVHVKEGDQVSIGDILVEFDLEKVEENAASTITPMVILNRDNVKSLEKKYKEQGNAGIEEVLIASL
ncbi:PTS sugar transporter subunit IIA [Niallia circulans]|uniref:PTS sugar transporter subunit IIA n=1 Tax=Niallia circulans TaxID=1397 RepID=UPI00352C6C4E